MPFLKIGMNAIVNRKAVRVAGVSNSGLKGKLINVDNKEIYFHPTWETAYYDESWNIIRDYRFVIRKSIYENRTDRRY